DMAPTQAIYGTFAIGDSFEVTLSAGSKDYVVAALWNHNKDGTYSVSYQVVKSKAAGLDPSQHALDGWEYPHWVYISVYCRDTLVTRTSSSVKSSVTSTAAQTTVK